MESIKLPTKILFFPGNSEGSLEMRSGIENQLQATRNFAESNSVIIVSGAKAHALLERKLNNKFDTASNNFIEALYLYMCISGDSHKKITGLTEKFTKNLARAAYFLFLGRMNPARSEGSIAKNSSLLNILVFILVCFIEKIQDNNIAPELIFSNKLIESFLSFRFQDSEYIMKSYQVIMVYLLRNHYSDARLKKYFNKSIVYHLGCKSLPENTALFFLSHLRRSLKHLTNQDLRLELTKSQTL